ncbi:hypothetical protein TSAR_012818 [Trichomalopsis sarcophagae]|uniref:DUF4218 domain-containing protein n=1 Tax=Trichomalopsis sarcophagae TaxID=543379 RepID=A0A232F3K3_9HYME|nr:hypothetical protein TSAR_012818 [Trichomalopsis sarcophagae]
MVLHHLNAQAPHQLARLSKPISERKDWKAKEWENFVLHYSAPIFRYLLDENLFQYWKLLVDSLHILLQDEITNDELDNADRMLHEFNVITQEKFTKVAMTFNVHQLLHLSSSVLHWGPLWCHSTYPFESAYHNLLQTIHCAKGVNLQIVRFINYEKCANYLKSNIYPHASPVVTKYLENIKKKKRHLLSANLNLLQTIHCAKGVNLQIVRFINYEKCANYLKSYIYPHASPVVIKYLENIKKKKSVRIYEKNGVTYLGYSAIMNPKILRDFDLSATATIYKRAVIKGCLYSSENKKNERSNNSFCQLKDNTFKNILYFIIDNENNKEVILCREVNTLNKISQSTFVVDNISNEIKVSDIKDIKTICVFIKIENNNYISTLPNLHHN